MFIEENKCAWALTSIQRSMLYQLHSEKASDLYIQQCVFHIKGAFNADCMCKAWVDLLLNNSILNTCLNERETFLKQGSWDAVTLETKVLLNDDAELIQRYLKSRRMRGINLKHEPLFRGFIIRFEYLPQWKLVFEFHHFLLDGASFYSILEELFQRYEAYVQRATPISFDRPALGLSYDNIDKDNTWQEVLTSCPIQLPIGFTHKPRLYKAKGERVMLSTGFNSTQHR